MSGRLRNECSLLLHNYKQYITLDRLRCASGGVRIQAITIDTCLARRSEVRISILTMFAVCSIENEETCPS